ncbi:MAG TPA: tRNA pseudouridine(55) synthase TruB [Candidatus Azosocius sp. HAIN]
MNEIILILNKPIGITSNSIIKKIEFLFKKKKIGHCGNLDVNASGILLICLKKINKKNNKYIYNFNKKYILKINLGYRTNTNDLNGKFISSNIKNINIKKNNFFYNIYKIHGISYQKPNIFSSVKYKGKNLYEYTRCGIKLFKKKKYIYINNIKIINKKNLLFSISCTKGTYIRSIIDFLGQQLICKSYMSFLHRINIGLFNIKKSIYLEDLLYKRYKKIIKLNIIKKYI